jgi:predicted HAD superfamily Cof-like phosphohydrolase
MDIEHFKKVGEFNTLFEHPCNAQVQIDIFNFKKIVDLRLKLIEEEFKELTKAISEQNMTEIIDGVCDLLYVVYGMMHVFGLNYCNKDDYCEEYNGERNPSAFSNENVMLMVELIGHRYQRIYSNCYSFTNSNYLKKNSEFSKEVLCEIYDDLEIIVELSYKIGYAFGFDVNKGFNIVHDSNMSKACKTEEEAKQSIESIIKDGIYKNPTYKLSKDKNFYILLSENGKILKSIYYKPAYLETLNLSKMSE